MEKKRRESQQKADDEYEKKRAGKRTRNWTVVFYPEDLPDDWRVLVNDLHVKWIESPMHDKDFNADGEPKKTHVHALFMFGVVKSQEQVEDMLREQFSASESGTIVGVAKPQQVKDRCALVRYMAHMDNPEKAQYDVSEIIGHNGADVAEILKYSATETREMIIAMEEYIEQHGITELSDFSSAIRYDHPEWHTILTTKMTMYFSAFIRSRRHIAQSKTERIDLETGEVFE